MFFNIQHLLEWNLDVTEETETLENEAVKQCVIDMNIYNYKYVFIIIIITLGRTLEVL